MTRCPDGVAKGAFNLSTRGTSLRVTIWPNRNNQLPPLRWNHVRGIPLWTQEMEIYVKECSPIIAARLMWQKLWDEVSAIPESEAIDPTAPPKHRGPKRKVFVPNPETDTIQRRLNRERVSRYRAKLRAKKVQETRVTQ